ncbi:MAG: hypothetical protein EBR79_02350 [Proteobacteria bacterium]|nr:hypothetical protein [Pseudomonadota bacterium]NBX86630.1 hypothetical protein [Pseudomonadota bacterium]
MAREIGEIIESINKMIVFTNNGLAVIASESGKDSEEFTGQMQFLAQQEALLSRAELLHAKLLEAKNYEEVDKILQDIVALDKEVVTWEEAHCFAQACEDERVSELA